MDIDEIVKGLWKKRLLTRIWIAFGVITLIAAVVFLAFTGDTPKSIVNVKYGSVNIINDSSGKMTPAEIGMELVPGNKIQTGSNGTAEIRLNDGSFLSMQENTVVEIVAFYANPWQGMQVAQFKLEYGDILINTGDNKKSLYEVTTDGFHLSVAEGVCRLTDDEIKPLTENCNVVIDKNGKTIEVPFESKLKIADDGSLNQVHHSKITNEDKELLLRAKPRLQIDKNPIITIDSDVTISGVSNPGNHISVDDKDTTIAGSNGRFKIEIKDHPIGEVVRKISSRDKAGRETTIDVTIKREKPVSMTNHKLEILFPVDDSTVDTPSVLVSGEIQGSKKIEINGVNVPFDGNSFEYNFQLSVGWSVIEIISTDENGETITRRRNIKRVAALESATLKIKEPKNGFLTTEKTITIMGTANTTHVHYKGKSYPVTNGKYSFEAQLKQGDNVIVVVAKDDDHKEKLIEITVKRVKESTPDPELTIDGYAKITNKSAVDIHGKTKNASTLTNGSTNVRINTDGSFDVYHLQLTEGKNHFELIATSIDGKTVKKTIDIIYDSIPPDLSKVKATRDSKTGNVTISGLIESLAKFEVNGEDYTSRAVTTNPEANQSSILEVIKNHKGNFIAIKATDLAGNITKKEVPIETKETP